MFTVGFGTLRARTKPPANQSCTKKGLFLVLSHKKHPIN